MVTHSLSAVSTDDYTGRTMRTHTNRLNSGSGPVLKSGSVPIPNTTMQRLVDLREILRYVPQYRDKVFVIAFDGAIVEHDNFRNLLLDLALLRSLRIGVALVHGAGLQIGKLAEKTGTTPSNLDGTGVT